MTTTNEPNVSRALDAELPAGTEVGEYVIASQIGVGGFGTVYRAEHPLIGKTVAIKVLGVKLSADPEMVSRFVAEARSVNQIQSKYIIDIFGFGQLPDGRQYYIMELLDGMPLDEYLDETGCVNLAEAVPILRGIAKALDAAHQNGVAHRDLKPENVFLVRDEQGGFRPKLLDFGIAKLLGEKDTMHKTRTGAPIGTPLYMSPEQCRGKGVDHRTDIYAFGCMSYRMLTGQVPFDGDGYMDILFKQIQAEPTPPSQVNPTLPPTIDAAIAKMMAKLPDDRPPTLAAAVRDLESAALSAGVTIPPGTSSAMFTPLPPTATPRRPVSGAFVEAATMAATDPGTIPEKRSPLLFIGLGAAVIAAGAIAFFAIQGSGKEEARTAAPDAGVVAVAPVQVDAAAKAAPPPPPVAKLVSLDIVGAPDGTEVYMSPRGLIGTLPVTLKLDRGDQELSIQLRADGFLPETIKVTPNDDQSIDVEMKAKPVKKTKKKKKKKKKTGGDGKPDRNSTENPFDKK